MLEVYWIIVLRLLTKFYAHVIHALLIFACNFSIGSFFFEYKNRVNDNLSNILHKYTCPQWRLWVLCGVNFPSLRDYNNNETLFQKKMPYIPKTINKDISKSLTLTIYALNIGWSLCSWTLICKIIERATIESNFIVLMTGKWVYNK